MPNFHVKRFATAFCPNGNIFSWDTDETPSVVENYATAIISNERKLLTRKFTPAKITLETAEVLTTKTNPVGDICMVLTDDSNVNHV